MRAPRFVVGRRRVALPATPLPEEQSASDAATFSRRAAYAKLAHAHEVALLRAARRMCGGDEDRAQDLVQDALVRGYEAFIEGRFCEGSNERAWLFRILTNAYINESRRRARGATIDFERLTADGQPYPESLQSRPDEQPERALMATLLAEPLERALAGLSDEARLVLLLVDIEELSYQEAAQALGVPVGTVRSRLSRARLQLHARLEHEEHRSPDDCSGGGWNGRS